MKFLAKLALALIALGLTAGTAAAQDLPTVRIENGASQLLLHGKPYLMLGGELGNSSSGTAAQADEILPRLAKLHFNTVLMPVAWDEIEPEEGHYDFSVPDHWIEVAREQNIHLVFLWFGSWKNAFSEYAPAWVLADTKRFPRDISAEGLPLEILSPLGEETQRCDARAFAALMTHVHERDAAQQTVIMIQVENEVGYLGVGGRDRSARANALFEQAVPAPLVQYLSGHRDQLSDELREQFHPPGHTWAEMFGDAADEIFMAWHYGLFVNQVVRAGKAAYTLPMYMNAQLPAPFEHGGDYPSGGPHPYYQAVYRAAAPSIDFYAPDIYWPDFEHWVGWYKQEGNPVFVPEARLDVAAGNALYTYGEARGFGFSPFAVDSIPAEASHAENGPGIGDVYATVASMSDAILEAQQKNQIRALVLHENSWRPSQTVALGGYLFRASLSRSWPTRQLAASNGAMMVMQSVPNEFLITGSGLSVTFLRDPDTDDQMAGIASIEQVANSGGKWVTERVLNGDQSDQGRQLLMAPHEMHVYRVRLYAYPQPSSGSPATQQVGH